ncbi:uncharacterized protein RSE6_01543 [Rhynchosporium secalis]|uniref:Asl1-like glycosyl hydrolase catalytic domain-containing protein n=1 Tax=Rhynchosporium secalis TaxID=38038 RepID=A0A1E1LY36_RHYSE|nr:uncharacterized protein RSE6_01543 [Rhynchosporium secalis]
MTSFKALLLLLFSSLLVLQVTAAYQHQHQRLHERHHEELLEETNSTSEARNPTIEARYSLAYPYNPKNTCKRGLAFNNPSKYIQTFKGHGSKVEWGYNWESYMDAGFPKNIEYVPMLWGDGADHTRDWFRNANDAIKRGSRHILAFNEPDACSGGGSCMSPQQAVNAYKQYIQPFKGRAYLGAPAVAGTTAGLSWLKEFLGLCRGCQIDFLPVHWYDSATNDAWFKLYMKQVHAATGKLKLKLWVTEFNAEGTIDQKTEFLRRIMPWMDSQSFIARYSWYWCDPASTMGPLVDGNGNPSGLGHVYTYA